MVRILEEMGLQRKNGEGPIEGSEVKSGPDYGSVGRTEDPGG